MTRITRCPSCDTVYKVGDAQLQQARGWLRCGHCTQAFDSTGLVLAWGPVSGELHHLSPGRAPVVASATVVGEPTSTTRGASERIDLDVFLRTPDRSAPIRSADAELVSFEEALSSFRPIQMPEPRPGGATGPGQFDRSADAQPATVAMSGAAHKSVGFGALATVGLACALLLQLVFVQRSAIVSHWPDTAPGLERACSWLGCQIAALRDPEALVIDSSAIVQRDDDHVLSWTLRNTSSRTLGVTAMEISLLDAQDQVLVRRVVQVSDWGGPETLAPGQVDSAQLAVRIDPVLQVSGYRLLSFYP
jgi:predicted Zn finger-like uncharacterized protein